MTRAVCVAYGAFLKEKVPRPIRTRKEYDANRQEIRDLMLETQLPPERAEYLELLVTLVEAYEREHVKLPEGSPQDILHELMDARDMKQVDLAKLVGSSGTASEIFNGKREISKALAKKLGEYFSVPHALFL
jgi:HTH-type transcriptional regulator / antitoxin HigA